MNIQINYECLFYISIVYSFYLLYKKCKENNLSNINIILFIILILLLFCFYCDIIICINNNISLNVSNNNMYRKIKITLGFFIALLIICEWKTDLNFAGERVLIRQ